MKFFRQFETFKAGAKAKITPELNRFSINVFIVIYFVFVITWLWLNLPYPLKPANEISKPLLARLGLIISLSGLDQNWTLFSPMVKTSNLYSVVVTSFQSGLIKVSELPRMEKLNIIQKWQQERFRKLFNDNFPQNKYGAIRPAVSRFLARAYAKPGNPPTRISYFLLSYPIPPPLLSNEPNNINEKKVLVENYFDYGVGPEDL